MSSSDESAAGSPAPRKRRKRYGGTHPRTFAERYKEHAPDRFPEMQAHIRAQGRTPAGAHVPILVDAVCVALQLKPGAIVADCTLGYGGHAAAFFNAISPGGTLIGLDIDGAQLERTRSRLTEQLHATPDALRLFHSNFAGLAGILARASITGCDAVFADLGVSSMQIDDPARGFSYKHDGPLDMRMDSRISRTAADWLRAMSLTELELVLRENADEPDAAKIAQTIVNMRAVRPAKTTRDLVQLVMQAKGLRRTRGPDFDDPPRDGELHPAARTFQALRILVNDELAALRNLLRISPDCLHPGGRIAILAFHSGEDRLVKRAFHDGVSAGVYSETNDEPIRADAAERRSNPRSSAAKLRWAVRAVHVEPGAP